MARKFMLFLRRLNRGIAILVGVMLLGCAGFVLLDVITRQLGSSFGGTDEVSGYAMAIATSWGMAFTMLELGHVRIDLLRSRFASRGRVLMDLFSMLVMTVVISVVAVHCWPVVANSIANNSTANTPLATPLPWVQLPWFAGWTWFAGMAWLTLLGALALVVRGDFDAAEGTIGAFAEQDAVI